MLRLFRNALLVLATLVVLGAGALAVLAHVYEDEVKATLVSAINEQLSTPVSVSEMDLTLVARFPQASMRLHNVLAKEVRTDDVVPDTLLFARELFLEFSLWDLFQGNYTVEQVHGEEVRLYAGLDGNGNENYIIWKTDTTTTASTAIALNKVSVDDLTVRFTDTRTDLHILAHHDKMVVRGQFSDAISELDLTGDISLAHWRQGERTLLKDRAGHASLAMDFGGTDGVFRITKGQVTTGNMPIDLTLVVTPMKDGKVLDLRANGLGLELSDVIAALPEGLTSSIKEYGMKGEVDLAIHYAGPLDKSGPELSVGAKITNGQMKESHSGTKFTNINGELALDLTATGVAKKLAVKSFSARSGSGSISGNWKSNGLSNAEVKADFKGDIALADLLRFAQIDTLEKVSGRLKANAQIAGKLRDMGNIRANDLAALRITGTLTLRDADLKMKGVRHRISHLDADLALHGNDATVQGLRAEFHENPVVLSGTLRNLVPYILFKDQRLVIEAKGSSPHIDLAALLRSDDAPTTNAKDYTLILPASIELDLQAHVAELVFEEFTATDIDGRLRMKDRVFTASPVSFSTASGKVTGTLSLDASTGRPNLAQSAIMPYPLAINAVVTNINVTALFKEFQDFGQDFIGHHHLSGTINAEVAFNAPLSASMKLDPDQVACVMDINMMNGTIKGHRPLLQVADYLQQNKLVAPFVDTKALRKNLGDVHFATLENQIAIRDGAVHIPNMLVSSNLMDIELSGTHYFDDRIDHHLNFRLSELLRTGELADEFGPITDDGTGMRIFLHMSGTADDPEFSNDGAMAADRRKKQFQNEKQELRSILREEFGLAKKSNSDPGATASTGAPKTQFTVIPAGADTLQTAGAQGPKKRTGLERFLNTKEEEPKAVFEVEN
ncbi:MAG: AsmA-like C-terminal region-containing protein [Flavobacteriales bacterium]